MTKLGKILAFGSMITFGAGALAISAVAVATYVKNSNNPNDSKDYIEVTRVNTPNCSAPGTPFYRGSENESSDKFEPGNIEKLAKNLIIDSEAIYYVTYKLEFTNDPYYFTSDFAKMDTNYGFPSVIDPQTPESTLVTYPGYMLFNNIVNCRNNYFNAVSKTESIDVDSSLNYYPLSYVNNNSKNNLPSKTYDLPIKTTRIGDGTQLGMIAEPKTIHKGYVYHVIIGSTTSSLYCW
ncbi:hypothetical protein FACS189459_5340 [Bacilli bacterium]|nr:hypothetical protein FACS189459_5340 [Bacilli bacterium]GHU51769.1 hypothetical protein FACS189496_0740 [Bacilli bacterium]